MKSTTALFMLTLLSVQIGCGKLNNQRIRNVVSGGNTAGLEEPVAGNLTEKEKPIAVRICSALMTRESTLKTTIAESKRLASIFALDRRDCKKNVIESAQIASEIVLESDRLAYNSADSKNYFRDVITAKHPALSELCPAIIADSTKEISNSTKIIFNKLYVSKFSTTGDFDTVQINTKAANNSGGLSPQDVQLITLYTKASQVVNARDLGAEKERSLFVSCSAVEFTTHKETFVRSVFL